MQHEISKLTGSTLQRRCLIRGSTIITQCRSPSTETVSNKRQYYHYLGVEVLHRD
ncbi:hypothetical protein BgiMline_010454, partial [Biomphalaria glabrata]